DFRAAVHLYSLALENELLVKVFRPYRDTDCPDRLPASRANKSQTKSIEALERYVARKEKATLGTMAHCIHNLGCKMADLRPNAFVDYLNGRLDGRSVFCKRFAGQLIRYSDEFRNPAAHPDHPKYLTLETCL